MTAPPDVARSRLNSCTSCPDQCQAYKSGQLAVVAAETSCPVGRWPAWKLVGLGDVVALAVKPAITAIQRAGLFQAPCGGCQGRQASLNRLVPDVTRPWRRPS